MMDEQRVSTTSTDIETSNSVDSRIRQLVDIPIQQKIIESLVSLFNYFDIYGTRIPVLYNIVTILRLFQFVGCAFMAANNNVFRPGTQTYKAMSILSVLFHLVPVEYRVGHEYIILFAVNIVLLL